MNINPTITAIFIDPTLPFDHRKVQLYSIEAKNIEEHSDVIKWCKETFPSDWGQFDSYVNLVTNVRGLNLFFKKNECLTAFLLKYHNGHSHNK